MIGLKQSLTAALIPMAISSVCAESGMASFYCDGQTASGEVIRPGGLTGAHRALAFGTKVLVA
jgi:rare lipoprotein A (peptidoglycan hydrolase)